MGASEPLRWHSWQRSWKIGATSLANVTAFAVSAGPAEVAASAPKSAAGRLTKAASAMNLAPVITRSLDTPSTNRQSSISLAMRTDNVKGVGAAMCEVSKQVSQPRGRDTHKHSGYS